MSTLQSIAVYLPVQILGSTSHCHSSAGFTGCSYAHNWMRAPPRLYVISSSPAQDRDFVLACNRKCEETPMRRRFYVACAVLGIGMAVSALSFLRPFPAWRRATKFRPN